VRLNAVKDHKYLLIEGNRRLAGNVTLSGYKHSSVVLVNAALLCEGVSRLSNLPFVRDVSLLLEMAKALGCKVCSKADAVEIDARHLTANACLDDWATVVHGSLYLIPVLVARAGQTKLFKPGGCQIGERPVEHVISILEAMGARRVKRNGEMWLEALDGLRGATFDLSRAHPREHSGQTKAALLAGVLAQGETRIISPFRAQEIEDLCNFLIQSGAQICKDENAITITGQSELEGTDYSIPADFLEFATLACAIQSAGGKARIQSVPPQTHFAEEIRLLRRCGIVIQERDGVTIIASGQAHPIRFTCPPIYSDLQPIVTAVLWQAAGMSVIRDDVWPDRFDHVEGLRRLGTRIERKGNTVRVTGPSLLYGTAIRANDLRSAAALLIAALGATGTSMLEGAEHLSRGYCNLPDKLRTLGASIEEVEGWTSY